MDIPLLKLEVVSQRGSGLLTGVTTIQRLNTKGGVIQGPCEAAGTFVSAEYSADYTFYKKPSWSLIPHASRNEQQHDQGKK
jgi:hypothetical protein